VSTISLATPSGPVTGYLAEPIGDSDVPGVVVVHDLFGLSADIRSIADRFATAGYLAVAPDLYARGGFARCVTGVFLALRRGTGEAVADVLAARQALLEHPRCTGRVGVVGYCMGGGFALVTAPRGFDASAPYYGLPPKPMPEALRGACPLVASYGRRDRALRGTAARLELACTELGIDHDVVEYADAGHGFANRLPFGPLAPVARVAGVGYHHPSAEDSWRRVLAFFAEHLAATPAA
jgi:carboxymethylenebutenolidase